MPLLGMLMIVLAVLVFHACITSACTSALLAETSSPAQTPSCRCPAAAPAWWTTSGRCRCSRRILIMLPMESCLAVHYSFRRSKTAAAHLSLPSMLSILKAKFQSMVWLCGQVIPCGAASALCSFLMPVADNQLGQPITPGHTLASRLRTGSAHADWICGLPADHLPRPERRRGRRWRKHQARGTLWCAPC